MNKPRIIKDYEKLSEEIVAKIKLQYPHGFEKKLILFKNSKGQLISALPFETTDYYYLIRMTRKEASEIIEQDEDYTDEGYLSIDAQERLSEQISESTDDYE